MARLSTIIGDGVSTSFDIACGFDTNTADVRLYQNNTPIPAFQFYRRTPVTTSLRLILTPAPPAGSITVRVSDGTERP